MGIKEKDPTTYAGILHYAAELSRGTSRRVARARPSQCQGLMSIAGGNTTDDPINHREFAAANESGEGEYRNKRRPEKHLGAEGKRPSSLHALYCEQLFLVQPCGATQSLA